MATEQIYLRQRTASHDVIGQTEQLNEAAHIPVIDPGLVEIEAAVQSLKEIFEQVRYTSRVPIMDIKTNLLPRLMQEPVQGDLIRMIQNIKVTDQYLYKHSIGVGLLSATIGKWLKLDKSLIQQLLLAGILHDIGKVKVPERILDKPGNLDDEEKEMIKMHSEWGYEILKGTVGLSNRIAIVALQHHEREDGSGYPGGLRGSQIDLFSKIVAVADIFHAMISERVHQSGMPSLMTLRHFAESMYGKLHMPILWLLFTKLLMQLIGRQVQLSDGSLGKVVYLNPYDWFRPLILRNNDYIDLTKRRDLSMNEVV
jgi:putative nucleotidyltransferase with HDIG domain